MKTELRFTHSAKLSVLSKARPPATLANLRDLLTHYELDATHYTMPSQGGRVAVSKLVFETHVRSRAAEQGAHFPRLSDMLATVRWADAKAVFDDKYGDSEYQRLLGEYRAATNDEEHRNAARAAVYAHCGMRINTEPSCKVHIHPRGYVRMVTEEDD